MSQVPERASRKSPSRPLRALRLRIKAALNVVLFGILNACVISPLLLSRNHLLRFNLFEAIGRSRYRGPLISGGDQVWFVHDSRDRGPGRDLFIRGTQDFAKYETACQLLRDHDVPPVTTLVDVGANIGTICIPAVKGGFVDRAIAVEAVPDIARLLHTNIALNGLTSAISVTTAAVSARSGEIIQVMVNGANQGDNRVVVSRLDDPDAARFIATIPVATTTLDDLLPDGADGVLVWMDIQGHEGIALSGACRTMVKQPPLVLEFCPMLMDQAGSYGALKSAVAGYRGFYDLANPVALRPISGLDALRTALGQTGRFTDILLL
jgi:FkbM family methyltransferase